MKNVKLLKYNAYATGEDGENYRAVMLTENGKLGWRLCKEVKPGRQWDFVNSVLYPTATAALACII